MYNFILLHYVDGDLVNRYDFGDDFRKAKDFAKVIKKESYQKGCHNIVIKEEFVNRPIELENYTVS